MNNRFIAAIVLCAVAIFGAMSGPVFSADWGPLPDSGQATCYNATGTITCPSSGQAFYGQDGNYSIGPARTYRVNGTSGTVTDLNTGLVWQQADDGTGRNWTNAGTYCGDLILGSRDDWRVPGIQELESLADVTGASPAINGSAFSGTKAAGYWSSTSYTANAANAYTVNFTNGFTGHNVKTGSLYVRCVRGGL